MTLSNTYRENEILELLQEIVDPEIPVLTIQDIGMLRGVEVTANEVVVKITPTYVGCPAMGVIEEDILKLLQDKGIVPSRVETVLSPAWTTDWITDEAKTKLENYGIAPPMEKTSDKSTLTGKPKYVRCPQCRSEQVEMVSQFGSTACKSLYKCKDCLEPFDYFKCI